MRNDDWMSNVGFFGGPRRIFVDKATHRVRFQNETESSVEIVIEPKEGA